MNKRVSIEKELIKIADNLNILYISVCRAHPKLQKNLMKKGNKAYFYFSKDS